MNAGLLGQSTLFESENERQKIEPVSFLVLTSGKFLEPLGSGIGSGSIFCLSFSLSNRVTIYLQMMKRLEPLF
jgi:hypothetical protein